MAPSAAGPEMYCWHLDSELSAFGFRGGCAADSSDLRASPGQPLGDRIVPYRADCYSRERGNVPNAGALVDIGAKPHVHASAQPASDVERQPAAQPAQAPQAFVAI